MSIGAFIGLENGSINSILMVSYEIMNEGSFMM